LGFGALTEENDMISRFQNLMTKGEAAIPSNWISSVLVLALMSMVIACALFYHLNPLKWINTSPETWSEQ